MTALVGAEGNVFGETGVTWLLRGMLPWEVPLGLAYEAGGPARFVGQASNGAFAPEPAGVFVLALVQAQD